MRNDAQFILTDPKHDYLQVNIIIRDGSLIKIFIYNKKNQKLVPKQGIVLT